MKRLAWMLVLMPSLGCVGIMQESIRRWASQTENCPPEKITIDPKSVGNYGPVVADVCGRRKLYRQIWVGRNYTYWQDVTPPEHATN